MVHQSCLGIASNFTHGKCLCQQTTARDQNNRGVQVVMRPAHRQHCCTQSLQLRVLRSVLAPSPKMCILLAPPTPPHLQSCLYLYHKYAYMSENLAAQPAESLLPGFPH